VVGAGVVVVVGGAVVVVIGAGVVIVVTCTHIKIMIKPSYIVSIIVHLHLSKGQKTKASKPQSTCNRNELYHPYTVSAFSSVVVDRYFQNIAISHAFA